MKLLRQLRAFFRKEKLDTEMSEEMRAHLELQAAENEKRGLAPDEARYAAQRAFGGEEQLKERCREQRGWPWLEYLVADVRYAVRQLRRNPGFTFTAIATLALGIGATSAIFSVLHAVVLRPLPYEAPGQLVQVWEAPKPGSVNWVSPGVFHDWRQGAAGFEDFAGYDTNIVNLTGGGEPERIRALRMTAGGLALLRAHAAVGRLFAPDEDQAGRESVVVLTHGLWQRRFGGDPAIVGRDIALADRPWRVIGVLPADFLLPRRADVVLPRVLAPRDLENHGSHFLQIFGRLKAGVTVDQARAELASIALRTKPLYPAWKREWGVGLAPLQEQITRTVKGPLFLLFGAVALVLLIAGVNVTNLLLARASARQPEMALRVALGAGRGRIVRQLLTESLVLAGLGTAAGLLLAQVSIDTLRRVLAGMDVARAGEIGLDGTVLAVAVGLALVTGLAFGLAPALQAARGNALQVTTRGGTPAGGRLRAGLIVGEVALAVVLLVGASLLLHSFHRVLRVAPGFAPDRAFTLDLSLPDQKYPDNARRVAFYEQLAAEVATLPGVEVTGLATRLSLRDGMPNVFFRIPGRKNHPEPGYLSDFDFCTPDYFRAMGIPLRRGRFFRAGEGEGVAIINETMARRYFSNEDPIGRHVQNGERVSEIVGIVGDLKVRGLEGRIEPMVYRVQNSDHPWRNAALVVRTSGPPLASYPAVRDVIRRLDPALPVANVNTLADALTASLGQRRLMLVLLGLFAVTALLLAAIGLYGVISYAVAQRTRELGIRVALGATRGDVMRLVVGQGMRLVAVGLAGGLLAAFGAARLLSTQLFEVEPTDALTFSVVPLVLAATALFAAWLPARRAAKVDPMVALRAE